MADFRTPEVEYADDKKDPENFVKIEIDIPKLKKNRFSKTASNADVDLKYSNDRSFALVVKVKGESEAFKYSIDMLPDQIDKSRSTCRVIKDGVIVLKLCKSSPRLWRELASTGLELGQGDN